MKFGVKPTWDDGYEGVNCWMFEGDLDHKQKNAYIREEFKKVFPDVTYTVSNKDGRTILVKVYIKPEDVLTYDEYVERIRYCSRDENRFRTENFLVVHTYEDMMKKITNGMCYDIYSEEALKKGYAWLKKGGQDKKYPLQLILPFKYNKACYWLDMAYASFNYNTYNPYEVPMLDFFNYECMLVFRKKA